MSKSTPTTSNKVSTFGDYFDIVRMPARMTGFTITQDIMKIHSVVSLVAVALCATTASAQRRTTTTAAGTTPTALEVGVDATADIGLGDNSFTIVSIPSGSMRVGFPMSPRVSIEPKAALSVVSSGGDTFTTYSAQVGALYHFDEAGRQRSGVYVRPAIGLSGVSGAGSHNTIFGGVGLGLKKPILPQLGSRFEAAFYHNFNNGSANELEFSAGLSWFTH